MLLNPREADSININDVGLPSKKWCNAKDACRTGPLDPGLVGKALQASAYTGIWDYCTVSQGDGGGPVNIAPDNLSASRLSEAQSNTTQPTFS
jgi:hypothetical protein